MSVININATKDREVKFTINGKDLYVPFRMVCHAADDIRDLYGYQGRRPPHHVFVKTRHGDTDGAESE